MVQDNKELLNLILDDWNKGSTISEVSGNLVGFYDSLIQDLRERPLRENIRNRIRGLTAVNGCDAHPAEVTKQRVSFNPEIADQKKPVIDSFLDLVAENSEAPILPYDLSLRDLDEASYRMCDLYGQVRGAAPLSDLQVSEAYFPEYAFGVNGKKYSYYLLYYYLHYAYCCRFIDFNQIENIIEVGPGAGRLVEVIKNFHPHINFYLVDLGPTLYICHQYLSALFPDSMVPYADTRDQDPVTLTGEGQIACVGNWKLEAIKPKGRTASLNTGVYCLMSHPVVERYMRELKRHADAIYLMEPLGDLCKDLYKLPQTTTMGAFQKMLEDSYSLVDRSPAIMPLNYRRGWGFESTMWLRR